LSPFELRNPAAKPRPRGCDRPHLYETPDGDLVCFTCGRPCSGEAAAEAWWKGDERFGGPLRSGSPFDKETHGGITGR
jgi:hypothetical protein